MNTSPTHRSEKSGGIKQAPPAVPRFVVLGPPGSGKSTLVQYLAWQAAQGTLPVAGPQLVPARVRLREWEVRSPLNEVPTSGW